MIHALDLETGRRSALARGVAPRYAPGGQVILARGTTLLAAVFDGSQLALAGPVVPLVEGVVNELEWAAVHYAIAPTGTLAYVPGSDRPRLVVAGADVADRLLLEEQRAFSRPRFSPDGGAVAVVAGGDVWTYDLREEVASRLTFDGAQGPIWTPDGSSITFERFRVGLYNKRADGQGDIEELLSLDRWAQPVGWTPDGRMLAFAVEEAGSFSCIAVLVEGQHRCVVSGAAAPTNLAMWWARLSPDGRWLAYQSSETGRDEVYVTEFSAAEARWQVSIDGGSGPAWSADGMEVYYRTGDRLLAARVAVTSGVRVLSRRVVLEPFLVVRPDDSDVHPDGRTVVMVRPLDDPERRDVVVVLNWSTEPRRAAGS